MNLLTWLDDVLELAPIVEKLLRDGFTLGLLLSVAVFLVRRYRKKFPNQLDRIERKVDIIAERMGIEWAAYGLKPSSTDSVMKNRLRFTSHILASTYVRIASLFTKYLTGGKHMKEYLKKLSSRKFQAFLAVTIPNLIIMFGFIFGGIDIEGQVNEWMPAINLVIQFITTAVYQGIEGGVDKANAQTTKTQDTYGDSGIAE